MKNFTIFLVSLLCVACASARQVTPSENTRVEVRTETVFQKDTVYLELPLLVEKVQTLDTMSVLENRYAKSEAIVADGVLVHSLATKPVKEPIEVETKVGLPRLSRLCGQDCQGDRGSRKTIVRAQQVLP